MELAGELFFTLVFVGVIVLIGVGVLRVLFSPAWSRERVTPEEILKERYARGEITAEEYWQVLKDLREQP